MSGIIDKLDKMTGSELLYRYVVANANYISSNAGAKETNLANDIHEYICHRLDQLSAALDVVEKARLYRAKEKAHEQDLANDEDNQITSVLELSGAEMDLDASLAAFDATQKEYE